MRVAAHVVAGLPSQSRAIRCTGEPARFSDRRHPCRPHLRRREERQRRGGRRGPPDAGLPLLRAQGVERRRVRGEARRRVERALRRSRLRRRQRAARGSQPSALGSDRVDPLLPRTRCCRWSRGRFSFRSARQARGPARASGCARHPTRCRARCYWCRPPRSPSCARKVERARAAALRAPSGGAFFSTTSSGASPRAPLCGVFGWLRQRGARSRAIPFA